jgi:hypothetical protein
MHVHDIHSRCITAVPDTVIRVFANFLSSGQYSYDAAKAFAVALVSMRQHCVTSEQILNNGTLRMQV